MDWKTQAMSVLLWIAFLLSSIHNVHAEQKVVCYYTNWSVYRPGTAKFSPQNINPYLCTHLIYAFGGFTKDNTLKPFDKYQDIEKGGYAKFNGLKTYNKKLKTMLAIGGWNEGSTRFSPLVADPERREELIKNTVKFLRQNHFDGLDLDWEYPAFRDGGKPRDRDNYADFVQELRDEFERESSKTGRSRLLLSMAIPAGIEYLEKGYDLPRLNEYLDFFNLLSYDYHSAFEPAVNHHSPLYGLQEDNEYNYDNELTIDYTISYLLEHEVTPNKLVLGIPTYGRSYTLFNEDAIEIGSPADGPGEEGDATREKGYLAYYEICENIAKSDEWEVVQPNPKAMGPYAVHGNQWVGYDDEEIVKVKAQYVNEKGLGGIMFWSIDNDDFRGKCHDRPYPLIEAAKEAMLTGNDRKSRPSQKTKLIGNRKKTPLQSDSHRSDYDSARHRVRTETNKRRTASTTPATRKRISFSRTTSRSSGKNRVNVERNDKRNAEDIETEDNSVREIANKNRNKSRPRTRTNRIASRRKVQSTRSDDELADEDGQREESLANKLTTPEPPTTPDPGSDFKCQDEGFFSHPRDCKKYFWCLDSGPSGLGIVANQFTCPSGLVFNKIADSCDYPRNVICPKTKSPSTVSTTKAPLTTPRATFQHKTTRRTTTTLAPSSAEEYEYDDDDSDIAQDDEDEEEEEIVNKNIVRSTTAKPLIYKTITRNRPTTAITTTTVSSTTAASRNFKPINHKVLDLKDEEDPRVIKELIDLIKKAGGLEQLEKQLNLHENPSSSKANAAKDEEGVTPATISRSLYERVLNRQATRIGSLFGTSTTRTNIPNTHVTEKIAINSRFNYQNGPGGAQFEGLDDVPEVQSLRRTNKPQYITIERPKPSSTQASFSNDEEEDDELPQQDEIEHDNTDVASSDERTISNPPDDNYGDDKDTLTKKMTPSYVNIRRTRPSTPANENDLENEDEPSSITFASIISNGAIQRHEESEKELSVPKFRYTNVERFRSTTPSDQSETSVADAFPFTETSLDVSIDPTIQSTIQEEKESSASSFSPTLSLTTIEIPSKSTTESANESVIATEFAVTTNSTTAETRQSITVDPVVTLIENTVTEIPQTTLSIITSPKPVQSSSIKTTTTIVHTRPFSFSRRGRLTTTPTPTTTSPLTTTEQNNVKVAPEYLKELPTLKELINNSIESNYNIIQPLALSTIKQNHSQDAHIPMRIQLPLEETKSKFDGEKISRINSTIDRSEKSATVDSTSVIFSTTEHVIRGFYVTKSLDQPNTTNAPTDIPDNLITVDTDSTTSTSTTTSHFTHYNKIKQQSTNAYLKIYTTLFPSTTIDELENDLESIHNPGKYQDETTENSPSYSTVLSLPTIFTTISPPLPLQTKEGRPVKQIVVHRRPSARNETQSTQQRLVAVHRDENIKNAETPRPGNWSKSIIRKRPISQLINDQNIAENHPHQSVTILAPPTIMLNVSNKSRIDDMKATVEHINLLRSPSILARKLGSITRSDGHNRFRTSFKNPIIVSTKVSETLYASTISADDYDQSSRAQEVLAVSIADPPTATSTIEPGNEATTKMRGIQRHNMEKKYDVFTQPPSIVRTTIAPVRRRQRPRNEDEINIDIATSPRSRRPAIIDYDYYVDEEVRLSIKPELKNKIYITRTGGIRCLDQGNFAHPTSCQKFITCAPMVGGHVIATEYTCPAKLSFDPVGGICNWSAGLGCKEPSTP